MLLRKCTHCGLEAHNEIGLKKFKIAKRSKYGRENRCRKCANIQHPQSLEKRKAYAKVYSKKWREKNPDYMREWRKKNPEYAKEYQREWRKKNPDYMAEKVKSKFTFNGKLIQPNKNPRANICLECGKKHPEDLNMQTDIHHIVYDEDDPLAFTVELCRSCHIKLHWKLRKG